jgi:hypothetical protein
LALTLHIGAGKESLKINTNLDKITQRQVSARRMDRVFLGFLAIVVTLSVSSVTMAVSAAAAPSAPIVSK